MSLKKKTIDESPIKTFLDYFSLLHENQNPFGYSESEPPLRVYGTTEHGSSIYFKYQSDAQRQVMSSLLQADEKLYLERLVLSVLKSRSQFQFDIRESITNRNEWAIRSDIECNIRTRERDLYILNRKKQKINKDYHHDNDNVFYHECLRATIPPEQLEKSNLISIKTNKNQHHRIRNNEIYVTSATFMNVFATMGSWSIN